MKICDIRNIVIVTIVRNFDTKRVNIKYLYFEEETVNIKTTVFNYTKRDFQLLHTWVSIKKRVESNFFNSFKFSNVESVNLMTSVCKWF